MWKYTESLQHPNNASDIFTPLSECFQCKYTYLSVWKSLSSSQPPGEEESGADTQFLTLFKFTYPHTHTEVLCVSVFQCCLFMRLLLPSVAANNKELNVFSTTEMDEKE